MRFIEFSADRTRNGWKKTCVKFFIARLAMRDLWNIQQSPDPPPRLSQCQTLKSGSWAIDDSAEFVEDEHDRGMLKGKSLQSGYRELATVLKKNLTTGPEGRQYRVSRRFCHFARCVTHSGRANLWLFAQ
jgi:hypothetical protein